MRDTFGYQSLPIKMTGAFGHLMKVVLQANKPYNYGNMQILFRLLGR